MENDPFPRDLLQTQRDWHAVRAALAAPRPPGNTALRRRLLRLSVRLQWHPYWTTTTPAARVRLRQLARPREGAGAP